ncbi:hypothetical protein GAMM_260005 [Gammaproteobacteria bacterium]
MIRALLGKISLQSVIFFVFAVIGSGMLYKYADNAGKIRELKTEIRVSKEKNGELNAKNTELAVRNEELLNQFDTQIKKQKELSEELLQLSEEKTNCYKKIIKYNEKLKKMAIKAPARVERLVNKHFDGVFQDIANTTRTDK